MHGQHKKRHTASLSVRLPAELRAAIESHAAQVGLDIGSWVRKALGDGCQMTTGLPFQPQISKLHGHDARVVRSP